MKILVIGGGGREHALCWHFSEWKHDVHCIPGSDAIAALGTLGAVDVADHNAILRYAIEAEIDLVVVGPEKPLVDGLSDVLRKAGVAVFGPSQQGARLEGSKEFSKDFFVKAGIPTARHFACADVAEVSAALEKLGGMVVVKADGLAGGKGVAVCDSQEEALENAKAMLDGAYGPAGGKLVVEERLFGREVSVIALCDGTKTLLLPPVEDHKTLLDGDKGPNTGGMGTVSPPSFELESEGGDRFLDRVQTLIFEPTLRELEKRGIEFRGVLYAGILVTADGTPNLLEYNVRFGDPEIQALVVRLNCDLADLLLQAAMGIMNSTSLALGAEASCCVVVASEGYPKQAQTGRPIEGLEELPNLVPGVKVFHSGTELRDGLWHSTGGRVLGLVACGDSGAGARQQAYRALGFLQMEGKQVRSDIGGRLCGVLKD